MDNELLDLINNYQTPQKAIDLINESRVVFLVGVSGAGKDTLLKELLKTDDYKLIVSHTTRPPRANLGVQEVDGQDYHFIGQDQAKIMLKNQEFVEAKKYSDNIYGTSIEEIENAKNENKIAISDIEVQGVAEYRAVSDKVIPIFILPPSYEAWQERLNSRYGEQKIDEEDIAKRMQTAKLELKEALEKDYFEYVVNDDLEAAIKTVDEIAKVNFSKTKNEQAKIIATDLYNKLNNNLG